MPKTKQNDVRVLPYNGYVSDKRLVAYARILKFKDTSSTDNDSIKDTIKDSWNRFFSEELEHTDVEVHIGEDKFSVTSNDEGYLLINRPWVDHRPFPSQIKYKYEGKAYPANLYTSDWHTPLIISDIDDTILKTDVLSKFRMLANSLFVDAKKRLPIAGSAPFFIGLQERLSASFFYVSNSPWNLYDYLQQFLQQNGFPGGPVLLRDFGFKNGTLEKAFETQKEQHILQILETFTEQPVILIGDASEHDPFIYERIKKRHPQRDIKVYIRSIGLESKMNEVLKWHEELKDEDVHLFESFEELGELS